ncbi:MAG TPA: hydrogenase maturation protease [Actinomycetota bacterium]|nr:hydrogenase maturation protease [Actinomycetota bacterium]
MTEERSPLADRILVAGIGNIWMKDDGFGGAVAKKLNEGSLPKGVTVTDFGIGGLDLAYELQGGFAALVLIDISRQGGEPGTLYVMEVDEDEIEGDIQDGMMMDPHGMDPQTVLRFIKSTGAWPGKVVIIACEPKEVGDFGLGLSPEIEAAVDRAVSLVLETITELQNEFAGQAAD